MHISTFETLETHLVGRVMSLGQQLARRMKVLYGVDRIGFLFAGSDVAHVHAHIIPMHEKMDVTSARYLVTPETVLWSSEQLLTSRSELELVRRELDFGPV